MNQPEGVNDLVSEILKKTPGVSGHVVGDSAGNEQNRTPAGVFSEQDVPSGIKKVYDSTGKEIKDIHGRSFSPEYHCVDENGDPIITKKRGTLKIRPGRPRKDGNPPGKQTTNSATAQNQQPRAPESFVDLGGVETLDEGTRADRETTQGDSIPPGVDQNPGPSLGEMVVELCVSAGSALAKGNPAAQPNPVIRQFMTNSWDRKFQEKGLEDLPVNWCITLSMVAWAVPVCMLPESVDNIKSFFGIFKKTSAQELHEDSDACMD